MTQQIDVDSRVLSFAADCIRELVSEVGRAAVDDREVLVERLAKAMQQACDQEYAALIEEVTDLSWRGMVSPRRLRGVSPLKRRGLRGV